MIFFYQKSQINLEIVVYQRKVIWPSLKEAQRWLEMATRWA